MKRVLVTGGAGFIGSHVVDRFLADGASVMVIDDLSSGSKANLSGSAELVQCDIRSPEARSVVQEFNPDLLVHAAAQMSVSESMKDPHHDATINVCGLVNLLQGHLTKKQSPYVIFVSTGGAIYGEQEQFPAPESHPIAPESFYGLSKRMGEMYLDFWNRSFGLEYGVVRLSNVYGPRQNPHGEAGVVAIFCKRMLEGKQPTIYGDGEQTRDYIYVGDVVDAIATMASGKNTGIFNIGTGNETSVNALLTGIMVALNTQVTPLYAPGRAGEQRRSVIDASHARNIFGWAPSKSLTEGLEVTCAWFKEQQA